MWPTVVPLGYINTMMENGKKGIVPDLERAPLLKRVFESYAEGNHAVIDVAKYAKSIGLITRKGKSITKSSMSSILRTRTYTGQFEWLGEIWNGTYEPIISRELWEKVQSILDHRRDHRVKNNTKTNYIYLFRGLLKCGRCGCSMVAEVKKKKYVYYHCSGGKKEKLGKCPDTYVREEVVEEQFIEALKDLYFTEDVADWAGEELKNTYRDEKAFQEKAIAQLQSQATKLINRLEGLYEDKLDGIISKEVYLSKYEKWSKEVEDKQAGIEKLAESSHIHLDEGIRILELSRRAAELYVAQDVSEKRKLLEMILSNSFWGDGMLTVKYQQPFDLIAKTAIEAREKEVEMGSDLAKSETWLPFLDLFRTKVLFLG